ncbi:hypothetical protein [Micromonospora kangleipakensis]|nr:hypothetical protein [Micromonospora kangleipakensis]
MVTRSAPGPRWHLPPADALAELFSLQDEFTAWLAAEPDTTAMHIPVV